MMSWHNCIQKAFAVIEFVIIFALILISLIAIVPGLCVRESAPRHLRL
jgi:competence protein ComGC